MTPTGDSQTMRRLALILSALSLVCAGTALGGDLPLVTPVERQPLAAQAQRIADALDFLGMPLSAGVLDSLSAAVAQGWGDKDIGELARFFREHMGQKLD